MPIRLEAQGLCGPLRRFVVPASNEMGERHGGLGQKSPRVEWVEPNGLVQAFDRSVRVTGIAAHPAAAQPGGGQVVIKLERSIGEPQGTLDVVEEERVD